MADKFVVSLDDVLAEVAGYVTIQGVEYPVLPITAPALQLVQRLQSDDPPSIPDVVAEAKKLCPTLPPNIWTDKPFSITGTIFGVSQHIVRKVEQALPNSSGPTTATSAEPSESPTH